MRKLLFVLALLWCPWAFGVIAYVGGACGSNALTTTNTAVVTYTSTTGNQLLVASSSVAVLISTVTDTALNSWSSASGVSGVVTAELWKTPASSTSVTAVTITNVSNAVFVACVVEYSGVGGQIGAGTQANGSSTTPSLAKTLAHGYDWWITTVGIAGVQTMTANSGNLRIQATVDGPSTNDRSVAVVDNTATTRSSVTNSVTISSQSWRVSGGEFGFVPVLNPQRVKAVTP